MLEKHCRVMLFNRVVLASELMISRLKRLQSFCLEMMKMMKKRLPGEEEDVVPPDLLLSTM
jgi:hypothetical protein